MNRTAPTLVQDNVRVRSSVMEVIHIPIGLLDDFVDLSIRDVSSGIGTSTLIGVGGLTRACEQALWAPAVVLRHLEGPAVAGLTNKDLVIRDSSFGDCNIVSEVCQCTARIYLLNERVFRVSVKFTTDDVSNRPLTIPVVQGGSLLTVASYAFP